MTLVNENWPYVVLLIFTIISLFIGIFSIRSLGKNFYIFVTGVVIFTVLFFIVEIYLTKYTDCNNLIISLFEIFGYICIFVGYKVIFYDAIINAEESKPQETNAEESKSQEQTL